MRKGALRVVVTTLFLLPIALPSASAQPLAAWQRDGSLVLDRLAGGARLEFPDGHHLTLELPERSELSALAALDAAAGSRRPAWLAAGSVLRETSLREANGETTPELRRELLLLTGDRQKARALPAPPGQAARFRLGAVPLVEEGRLVGLAWLEGAGRGSLGVRASRWDGRRWSPPETVAPPGPGSQLALAGTVLADGSWLLAWSAFDGGDDEIVWTRRRGASWERPRRVSADNDVPDITPTLLALPGDGAVLAWSRYDGSDYRLVLSRLEGDAWVGESLVGDAGTLYPALVGGDGEAHLLFFDAASGAASEDRWRVARVEASPQAGQAVRLLAIRGAAAPGDGQAGDPALVRAPDGELALRFSGRAEAVSLRPDAPLEAQR